MKTKTIKQKAIIPAEPMQVYDLLMGSKGHAAFTDHAAKVTDKVGAKFTAYDGYISGKNLKLVKGKKIVQSWKAAETEWPEKHWSEVIFELKKKGKGTEIIFTHKEVPAPLVKSLSNGWKEYYWKLMKEYFNSKKQK